jgi:hypothetical protein
VRGENFYMRGRGNEGTEEMRMKEGAIRRRIGEVVK